MHQYIDKINRLIDPTFQHIRTIANESLNPLSKEVRAKLWEQLNHGINLLDSHELMCQYLWSFGNMHEAKISEALINIPKTDFKSEFDIVDWGCGQGLATISFFDYLSSSNLKEQVRNVTLIEPSKMALERATLHVNAYLKDIGKIKPIRKYLSDVTNEDIQSDGVRPVLHFFSNILDIKEIDLKELATKLNQSVVNDSLIICVGPLNAGNRRIDAFHNYFDVPVIFDKRESLFNYGNNKTCTCIIKVYKLEFTAQGNLIPFEFYPSVQFHAGYQLDCIKEKRAQLDKSLQNRIDAFYERLTSFETFAPFDIGANVYDDVHPIFAVLNNIITRGLPTRTSPFIESTFEQAFGFTQQKNENGEIIFELKKDIEYIKVLTWTAKLLNSSLTPDYSLIDSTHLQLVLSPIAIARVQKTILEALMTDKLDISLDTWKILVNEKDVPCAAIAFKDLEQIFNNLTKLSAIYQSLKFPKVKLSIISNVEFHNSPLHLDIKPTTESIPLYLKTEYDLVIDISILQQNELDKKAFSQFKCKNFSYFNIRSASSQRNARTVYTTDKIQYRSLVEKDSQGLYLENKEAKEILQYFLQLIFRKEDFRPGQLPILSRALLNKGVIGLLPTGGGKSLTYQLAALLQPGVTIIVDPLSSLMKDQYDSLINGGIDCCTFINSTVSSEEKEKREIQMESSEMLFVFLSPERLGIYKFRERLKNMHELNVYFSYGVIDEVHCVSEWGHDFRISYLHLGRNLYQYVRTKVGNISLFGLTATASFDVLADVERELSADGAFNLDSDTIVRYENTNRLELQYRIEKINVEFEEDIFFDTGKKLNSTLPKAVRIADNRTFHKAKNSFLVKYINDISGYLNELQTDDAIDKIKTSFLERQDTDESIKNDLKVEMPNDFFTKNDTYKQSGIVFCPHKTSTGISVDINKASLGVIIPDIGSFYGGDDDGSSMKNLELFRDSKQPIMVATKAFGMGIDKPNVRFTINMNYSSSLESFVQEAGRAGRDRKMALSVILLSDYKLVRINKKYLEITFPFEVIKDKWFKPEDLKTILNYYKLKIDAKHIDYCTPSQDIVKLFCENKNIVGNNIFSFNLCNDKSCDDFFKCKLKEVPKEAKGWYYEKDLIEILEAEKLSIERKSFQYQNTDYETVMYFYNNSFKGAIIEKKFMHNLLSVAPIKIFYGDDAEIKSNNIKLVEGFLTSLLDSEKDEKIVSFIPYIDSENDTDIAKAIYRMSCIELIEDFTQDYKNSRYRIVSKRKAQGEYYNGLKRFLLRYYTEDRAEQEIAKANSYNLKVISENNLENEIHKCLAFLTEFVYEKISLKRKRAIDDMRTFCIQGVDETKDWKDRNEDLKDFIYYYFNSKYAKDDYVADNGEPYSLTQDTDRGKTSAIDVLFKFMKVIDDELVGVGIPKDNAKHLQGAVRLIRRSLTDDNPTLSLLNAFCLFYIGTNNNENLEKELVTSYREGLMGFENVTENSKDFWKLFEKYNSIICKFSNKKQLSQLSNEVILSIHGNHLKNITDKYLQ